MILCAHLLIGYSLDLNNVGNGNTLMHNDIGVSFVPRGMHKLKRNKTVRNTEQWNQAFSPHLRADASERGLSLSTRSIRAR